MKGLPKDRGAAAVEFALVMPVLLSLVVGIGEFGRACNVQSTLSGAAREGVRVMAVKNDSAAARAATKAAALPWSLTDSDQHLASTCPSASTTRRSSATVTVTYALPFIQGHIFRPNRHSHGKGTMRVQRLEASEVSEVL